MSGRDAVGALGTVSADVVVIGAGPAGLSAATRLRNLGVASVLVLEREQQAGQRGERKGNGQTEPRRPQAQSRHRRRFLSLSWL